VDDNDIEVNEDFFLDLTSDDRAFGSSVPTSSNRHCWWWEQWDV